MMSLNEKYKKISWIYQIPKIFCEGKIYDKRLDTLPRADQENLIYKLIQSFYNYFGRFPGNTENKSSLDFEKSKENLKFMMEIWLSGLCDLTVSQIIEGLLDIFNLKTEYLKWPPASVIEFYSVCKKLKPPYHESFVRRESIRKIEFNQYERDLLTRKRQIICMNESFKSLGKNYVSYLEDKINKLDKKLNRSEKETKQFISYKESLGILLKNANI